MRNHVLTLKKQPSCLLVRRHTLKKCEGIANAVRSMGREVWRRKHGVNAYDLLEQRRYRAERVP